jgi:beta-lactamase class A
LDTEHQKNILSIGERKALQSKIQDYINAEKKKGDLVEAGVYFRDLNGGPIFGVNDSAKFFPASLLKVPLAIWFYHEASTTDFLSQEIEFTGPKGIQKVYFPPAHSVEIGHIYSLEDLLRLMLQESDNDATAILGSMTDITKTDSVYSDLGIEKIKDYNTYTTDVHTYGAFFRVLYFVGYLDREKSNHVLELLAGTSFKQGLAAGVPDTVKISHKFGEKDNVSGIHQLHDCGIIYYEKGPYLLCVMTQGSDYNKQATFIQTVSKDVYDAVSKE